MYSIVMMAALASGADGTAPVAPVVMAAPVAAGCCGYSASCGGYAAGCGGGYSYGCGGGYSYGCGGGYSYGCGGYSAGQRWHGHKHGCVSYGNCGYIFGPSYGYGGGSNNCGYSYGCYGSVGCYGTWSHGCGNLPPYGPYNIGGGGGGMSYGAPYYNTNGAPYVAPAAGAPTVPGGSVAPMTPSSPTTPSTMPPAGTVPAPKPVGGSGSTGSGTANLHFTVPARAKLYVDGRETAGTGEERAFYTPALEPGRKFFYDVKAVIEINEEKIVEEKRVIVQAGDDLREAFPRLLGLARNKFLTTTAPATAQK